MSKKLISEITDSSKKKKKTNKPEQKAEQISVTEQPKQVENPDLLPQQFTQLELHKAEQIDVPERIEPLKPIEAKPSDNHKSASAGKTVSGVFSFIWGGGLGPMGWATDQIGKRIASDDDVLESWSFMIEGGGHKVNQVFDNIEKNIRKSNLPFNIERKQMAPSVLGLVGNRREFLVISNKKQKNYQMLINIREYGNCLDCSWYLTFKPPLWRVVGSRTPGVSLFIRGYDVIKKISLFDRQDLTSDLTINHHCVVSAIEDLMLELNQPVNIDRKSRGFLFIS